MTAVGYAWTVLSVGVILAGVAWWQRITALADRADACGFATALAVPCDASAVPAVAWTVVAVVAAVAAIAAGLWIVLRSAAAR